MKHALVVAGSANEERIFGLASGERVAEALRARGWRVDLIDGGEPKLVIEAIKVLTADSVVVPVGFGAGGAEDGWFYAISRIYGIPCTGPTPAAGELCLDKQVFQTLVKGLFSTDLCVATPIGVYVHRFTSRQQVSESIAHLKLPLIVKPNFGGSSVGLEVFDSYDGATDCAVRLSIAASAVLVQELVQPAVEVSVTVLDTASGRRVLPIVELLRDASVFTYDEKFGPTASQRHRIPAHISPGAVSRAAWVAETIHERLGLCGLARYDMLIQDERIVVLECNAIPGLLPTSIACDAARAEGYQFEQFIEAYALAAYLPRVQAPVFWDRSSELKLDPIEVSQCK